MDPMSLKDIIAAQHAYAAARSQALQAASAPGADPTTVVRAQHQALLQYLQSRVSLLTKARADALQQIGAEIATFQQKIGQVQQLLQADDASKTPTPVAPPTASPPAKPGAAAAAPKKNPPVDPKKGR